MHVLNHTATQTDLVRTSIEELRSGIFPNSPLVVSALASNLPFLFPFDDANGPIVSWDIPATLSHPLPLIGDGLVNTSTDCLLSRSLDFTNLVASLGDKSSTAVAVVVLPFIQSFLVDPSNLALASLVALQSLQYYPAGHGAGATAP